MRVLHFSKYDMRGGAAIAALNSVRSQRALGLDATLAVGRKLGAEPFVHGPSGLATLHAALAFAVERLPSRALGASRFDVRSIGLMGLDPRPAIRAHDPDVVVLHNIDGLLALRMLPWIDRPVVWRMHDMWPAIGSRHYEEPGAPLRGLAGRIDRWVSGRKRAAYARMRELVLCPPSHWLAEVARVSPLTRGYACEVIPNGVDIEAFKPGSGREARSALGIAEGQVVIAFGASGGVGEPRKGGDLLREALRAGAEELRAARAHLLVFGGGGESFADLGLPLTALDQRDSRLGMAQIYQAADLLAAPSRMENLSLVVLEAMACATPVLAFRIGGMPDMIVDGETGWLAEPVSPDALGTALLRAIGQLDHDDAIGQRARAAVETRFSLETEAMAMRHLFERLTSARNTPAG